MRDDIRALYKQLTHELDVLHTSQTHTLGHKCIQILFRSSDIFPKDRGVKGLYTGAVLRGGPGT